MTYGPQFHVCQEAISEMESELGVTIELIDLMTLFPFDLETIAKSVTKTGRLLISHEGPKHNSLSSEIASQVMESCFYSLVSPIERVCGLDTPFPLSLEHLYLPNKIKLKDSIKRLLEN